MTIKKVLTIAGSDSSGGAGLQADLKTFEEYGTFGFTAITAIVTMDPYHNWRHEVYPMDTELVNKQLQTIFSGGPVDAMKTGMLGSVDMIKLVNNMIRKYKVKHVVIDPVMVCKGEDEPLAPENEDAIREFLVPEADIVTPNLYEVGQLSGMKNLRTVDDLKEAARRIVGLGARNVVIKGGKRWKTIKQLTSSMMVHSLFFMKRRRFIRIIIMVPDVHLPQLLRQDLQRDYRYKKR